MKVKDLKIILLLILVAGALSAEPLSLEQAVSLALEHSAEVKISKAELIAQQRRRISSWLELGPRMSLSYNQAFYDNKLIVPWNGQDILMRDDVIKTGSLTLTQPITGLFALTEKARLEGKQKALKETTFNLTERQIAFKTAELYLRGQQSESMWNVANAN
ncbi:MAG TPA: TolC family protein, partial [Myxococcota bacterium]|nr:TolC family protein [Myxococcota bacterium]